MLKAFKYRIYPNKNQRVLLDKHFGCARFVYNLALECKQMAYLGQKINLSAYDLINQLPDLKKECEWLKEVHSQTLQQSIYNLDKAFTRFFKHNSEFPKFKSKRQLKQSFCSPSPILIKIKEGKIWLPKFKTGIKIIQERPLKGNIKNVTISISSTGKYFASILCETEEIKPASAPILESTSLGIDLGIKNYIVTSDGLEVDNPKYLRKSIDRLKVLQRRMRNKKNGSSNQKKSYRRIAIIHERIANKRKDFLHKLSTQLIRDNQTICCEDLKIKNMMKNHRLAGSIGDAGWGMFVDMLKYKAEWYGKNLLQIPTFEASTKVCHHCGSVNHSLTLKDREWLCANCGKLHHRDINAAKVIKAYCLRNSGSASPAEPLELPTLVGALKKEDVISVN